MLDFNFKVKIFTSSFTKRHLTNTFLNFSFCKSILAETCKNSYLYKNTKIILYDFQIKILIKKLSLSI